MAALQLSEDEIDDLIYFARAGEEQDLLEALSTITNKAGSEATPLTVLSEAKDEGKNTPLHMAAANGHESIVKTLLDQIKERPETERRAFLDSVNEYGNTALHWSAMNGHLEVVKLLVDHGASPALANDKNYVPLDLAGLNDKVNVVDYFLSSMRDSEKDNGTDADGLNTATASVGLDDEADEIEEGKTPDKS